MQILLNSHYAQGDVRSDLLQQPNTEVQSLFSSYLTDESRLQGNASQVVFPLNEAEIAYVLQKASADNIPVTISAGRTGVVGGAVPMSGWSVSLERMVQVHSLSWNAEQNCFILTIDPGIPLEVLQKQLLSGHFPFSRLLTAEETSILERYRRESTSWIFPPDPTETTAQIGGMTATNASGAKTFFYGATRNHIAGIRCILIDGSVLELVRGKYLAGPNDEFVVTSPFGNVFKLQVPTYKIPNGKHAAGYFASTPLDIIDLFIGSEGTLGVISSVDLRLTHITGTAAEVVALFPSVESACHYVRNMREKANTDHLRVEALEYMGPNAIDLLREHVFNREYPELVPDGDIAAVFTSIRIQKEPATALEEILEVISASGGLPDRSLAAFSPVDIERLKHIRHALPETVNKLVSKIREQHPKITKLGTDMAVPDKHLEAVMGMYSSRLTEEGYTHYIFGHIGDNHLHVNIIPHNPAQYTRGKELYASFAKDVVKMGGSVSAEHGLGKIKSYLLDYQFATEDIEQMKHIKTQLDPNHLLGAGNLFGTP